MLAVSWVAPACFSDPPTVDAPAPEGSSSAADETSAEPSGSATSTSGATTGALDDVGDDASTGSSTSGPATSTTTEGTTAEASTGEPEAPRLVFVTEGAFFANLGGVAGADARCAAEAEAAGRRGEHLAWVSVDDLSPDARFTREGGPWVLADGSVVAEGWDDLVDGTLSHPIDLDATGTPIDDMLAVWTNTDWNGQALAGDCQGWTSMAFADAGIFGDFRDDAFGQWTAWGNPTPFPCENTFHLYCFEQ